MAKLIVMKDDEVLSEQSLNKECITIGRRPDNDIHIDNLSVSGQHCQIITILNDSFIEDLNSTNGTLVNNKTIKKHALANGDIIMLGEHQLKYVNELASASAVAEDEFEKTMIIRPDAMGMPANMANQETEASVGKISSELSESLRESEAATKTDVSASLRILNGSNAGKELALNKALTTLGKPGHQVSAITRRPQGFAIVHVEGDAFPMINGETASKGMHPLSDGDIIEVSGIKMEFILN